MTIRRSNPSDNAGPCTGIPCKLFISIPLLALNLLLFQWTVSGTVILRPSNASAATASPPAHGFASANQPIPFSHVIIDSARLHPVAKTTGDVDGDGFDDVVVGSDTGTEGLYWYEYPHWDRHTIVAPGVGFAVDTQLGDVDRDGDLDVIIPEWQTTGTSVWWYENPRPTADPRTDPWIQHTIGTAPAHDVEIGDLDKDGHLDVVVRKGQTTLFLQVDPNSWIPVVLSSRAREGLALGDVDRDGDPDVAINGYWLENPLPTGDPVVDPWTEHLIDTGWPDDASTHMVDVNRDGRLDVLFAPMHNASGRLSWYEGPPDPRTTSWTEHVIDSDVSYFHAVKSADMDRDGDIDVVAGETQESVDPDEVFVYINEGGGLAWTQQIVDTTGIHNFRLTDIGKDGDFDIVGANWSGTVPVDLWQNDLDPKLTLDTWQRHVIDPAKPWRTVLITAADLDGDAAQDIITGGWWYRNPGSAGGVWARDTLGAPLNNMAAVYDFDLDGDLDVLGTRGVGSSPNDSLVWARNDGATSFSILDNIDIADGDFLQGAAVLPFESGGMPAIALSWHQPGRGLQVISVPTDPSALQWTWEMISPFSQDEDLSAGDIDRDGDLDLLLGTEWLRNDGGAWISHTLFATTDEPDRNRLADINRDGRPDAVVGYEAVSTPGKLAWYEQGSSPTDPWTEHIIANVIGPMSLDVADMDRDGDLDVVVGEHNLAAPQTAQLVVFENTNGVGTNWAPHKVYTGDEHHDGAHVVDIDADGDLDIISIGWGHDRVVLYENKAIDGGGPLNQPPVAVLNANPTRGPAPLQVTFDASGSYDPDGDALTYSWGFGDGSPPENDVIAVHTYPTGGEFTATLIVSDGRDADTTETTIVVDDIPGPTDGLIHYWNFDEGTGSTAKDIVGFADGILMGPTWDVAGGVIGGCLSFDGVDDYVDLGTMDIQTDSGLTIALWFKADDFDVQDGRIISKASSTSGRDHFWMLSTIDSTALRLRLKSDDETDLITTSTGEITTERWYHLAATYDGAAMRIYKNAVELVTRPKTGPVNTDSTVFAAIGNQPFGAGIRPFDGVIDDVRIYNRALSPEELASLFGYTLTTTTVGSGSIAKSPDRQGYASGDTVIVTAVPAPTWSFSFWGEGLSGTENPDTIVIVSDTTVVAVFETESEILIGGISDYCDAGENEAAVADLVDSYNPDFIVTAGDNSQGPASIDFNIGQFYSDYIGNYPGSYGPGSAPNRFFPALGNHDYHDGGGLDAYLNYFTLPDSGVLDDNTSGNERYYNFVRGPVHFFIINSNPEEPDGRTSTSTQAQWLQAQLAASTSTWNVVCMHHPPYSSGSHHGSEVVMQWPYEDWGATVVLCGHDHVYERILRDDNDDETMFPYLIIGLGGRSIRDFGPPIPGSVVRYNGDFGGLIVHASETSITFEFHSINPAHGTNGLIDTYTIEREPIEYQVTVNTVGNGSVTKIPDQPSYVFGDTVIVTALPDSGWVFDSWSNGLSGNENPDTIVVAGDTAITATFTEFPTGIHDTRVPKRLALYQNKPNPFNPTTVIQFALDRDGHAVLSIHDVAGREVRRLLDRRLTAGFYEERWDGRDHRGTRVATGVYFYRLHTSHKTLTRKAVLLK